MDRTVIGAACVGLGLALAVYSYKTRLKAHDRRVPATVATGAEESAGESSGTVTQARTQHSNKPSCRTEDLRLRLPIDGVAGKDWVVANYFDVDIATNRYRDYMGNTGASAITYEGHSGIDFELPSFRPMDRGYPALASADGVVEETWDQSPDRNRTCNHHERWNFVRLRHNNGYSTIYAHLRRDSVLVNVGARVAAGAKLGLIGSSGCSSYPHLHLEVQDCQNQALDMIQARIFEAPPVYAQQMSAMVMETTLFQPAIDDMGSVQEPGENDVSQVRLGEQFSLGLTISNLKTGDHLRVDFITPNNTIAPFTFEQRATSFHTRSHYWVSYAAEQRGQWLARVSINGRSQVERPIVVVGD